MSLIPNLSVGAKPRLPPICPYKHAQCSQQTPQHLCKNLPWNSGPGAQPRMPRHDRLTNSPSVPKLISCIGPNGKLSTASTEARVSPPMKLPGPVLSITEPLLVAENQQLFKEYVMFTLATGRIFHPWSFSRKKNNHLVMTNIAMENPRTQWCF